MNAIFNFQFLINVMNMLSQRRITDIKLLTDIRTVFAVVYKLENFQFSFGKPFFLSELSKVGALGICGKGLGRYFKV